MRLGRQKGAVAGLIVAVFGLGLAGTTWAKSSAASLRVGVVDIQHIIAVSVRGARAREEFKQQILARQAKIDQYEQELRRLEGDYREKEPVLAGEEKAEYLARFRFQVRELKRKGEDVREELSRIEKELTTDLLADLERLIQLYGREHQYDLILEKNSLGESYVGEAIDLTPTITQLFDAADLMKELIPQEGK